MSRRDSFRLPAADLSATAAAYQDAAVIPHCAVCTKPCCKLDKLVLELEWKQVKILWRLDESRPFFDRRLAAGTGPEEIREGNGLYYVHSKACPAYDEAGRSCKIYGQDIKPLGCTDFPVYEDGGSLIADLRCEAVDLDALVAWIGRSVGPEYRIIRTADREFPFLVTLSLKNTGVSTSSGKRSRGRK